MASARYHERHDARSGGNVEGGDVSFSEFDASDGLFRFEYGSLPRASIVDEIASHNRDCAVCEANSKLRQVVERGKGRYRKLLAAVVDGERALAPRDARLLLQLVQRPHLQHRLVGHVLGDGDQQRRPLDLLHVRDCARVIRPEGAHDLEGLRQHADDAIGAAHKDALGPRDDACRAPRLPCVSEGAYAGRARSYLGEEGALVAGELDLRHVEELELPLLEL